MLALVRSHRRSIKVIILAIMILVALIPLSVSANVTVSSFTAKWSGSKVVVTWSTATELNNAGFNIYRSTSQTGTFTKINSPMIPSLCIGCVSGVDYPPYDDTTVTVGVTYYYKLEAIENSGSKQLFGPVTAAATSPTATKTAATSTRTPTPSATATSTRTFTPSSTPTITPTYPPGVTPPTPLPTSTPTATPTRTQTYPPGVKPPTPKPATATSQPLVAVVPPVSTPVQLDQNLAVATLPNANSLSDSSSAQGASPSTDTTVPPEESSDNAEDAATEQTSSTAMLFRLGIIVVSGMLGLGALVFGGLAIFLFVRFSRHGS